MPQTRPAAVGPASAFACQQTGRPARPTVRGAEPQRGRPQARVSSLAWVGKAASVQPHGGIRGHARFLVSRHSRERCLADTRACGRGPATAGSVGVAHRGHALGSGGVGRRPSEVDREVRFALELIVSALIPCDANPQFDSPALNPGARLPDLGICAGVSQLPRSAGFCCSRSRSFSISLLKLYLFDMVCCIKFTRATGFVSADGI
jgi:hypothetical protein